MKTLVAIVWFGLPLWAWMTAHVVERIRSRPAIARHTDGGANSGNADLADSSDC